MHQSKKMSRSGPHRRNRWLMLIAFYKLIQSLLFIAIGVGALRLVHKDVGDMFLILADHLRFNPEARIVHFVLVEASLVNDPLLRRIGAAAFCYAGISMAEGIGLYLEKLWGEILTLLVTASFLPWEIMEIARRLTWPRLILLAINIAVFIYLLRALTDRQRLRRLRKVAA
jgi:uncharacterized membrane protein (DUF2068 family)